MKYECRHCGYVGPPAYPSPIGSRSGEIPQPIPACPKCYIGNLVSVD